MTDAVTAASPNGGGVKKKRHRKRGGGGVGGLKPGSNSAGGAKDGSGRGSGSVGLPSAAGTSSARGRGSGSRGGAARRGGMGGGGRGPGGGGGGILSSRFKPNAPSPLQLPFVKVTIRNIGDGSKHSSIENIAISVRKFLEGAFPSSATSALGSSSGGSNESSNSAYMLACQLEREEFEADKNMVSEATAEARATGGATFASQIFSSGWMNDDKARLPGPEDIVDNIMNNSTDKKFTAGGNSIGWIVDTAMSQMMQECGKQYLNYAGGKIVLDEESFVEVSLAEKVQSVRKRMELERKREVDESNEAPIVSDLIAGKQPNDVIDKPVDDVTKGIATMSTSDKHEIPKVEDQSPHQSPAVRVRIVSITPVKKSKRRGEIGGKVTLTLTSPDPCLLFKEKCRDAGKMAADKYLSMVNTEKEHEAVAARTLSDGTMKGVSDGKGDIDKSEDQPSKSHADIQTVQSENDNGANSSKRMMAPTTPQIPYYPILSSMERSRALARSRVLMSRIIKAMELHAARSKLEWDVQESVSQKTWKERPHYFVRATMDGKPLSDLVAEHDASTNTAAKKGRGKGGIDPRADRLESTIESSDDYKAFLASLENGSIPSNKGKDASGNGKKEADSRTMATSAEKQVISAVDGDGRPLAAIVLHLREKQEAEKAKVQKAKAEIAAAQAKARAAVAAAKEKARQEKDKAQKEASRKQKQKEKEEIGRKKKQSSRASSSRTVGSGGGDRSKKGVMPMPPPGAMLLKKVGGSCPIPPSGFG